MRILFVWTGVTSYMADCWRELQRTEGVELKIAVEDVDSGKEFDRARVLAGLDGDIAGWTPDVIFAGGWRSPTTRRIVAKFPETPKVFCLDMPWRWKLRCIVARFALWGFLRKFDAVFVPGSSSSRYARWLGFPANAIWRGLYSVDASKFAVAGKGGVERRGFLYVGRYSPEKRVDLVEKAHALYRSLGGTWDLDCYGQGGKFAQADEMPGIYASHACLLLASSFDPWPLVMLEARMSGMDVVASDRCGNCDELGVAKVPYGDVRAMARKMLEIERKWCDASAQHSEAEPAIKEFYCCAAWAKRVLDICAQVRRGKFFCPGMDDVANGMAVVARLLSSDDAFRGKYVVHGAWLPSTWIRCLASLMRFSRSGYLRMPHGACSPIYLECCGKWKKRIVGPVERFFLRRADRILVTCNEERGWVESYLGRRCPPVEVLDLKKFFNLGRTVREKRDGRPLHLLYLGRRHPLKGVRYLEDAVKGLADVELHVVSDACGEEKERAWDWCDVLILPTLSENFGLVVAEALERGKRVITTDGAPAWRGQPNVAYVEGFRDGTDAERTTLLRDAIVNVGLSL